jgi:hypothetical protein
LAWLTDRVHSPRAERWATTFPIERSGDMDIAMGVHPDGDGSFFNDGQGHLFHG